MQSYIILPSSLFQSACHQYSSSLICGSFFESSHSQKLSLRLELFPAFIVVRQDLSDFIPKSFRMIHLLTVTELMYNHIVNHILRCQHQKAVEIQIPFCTAASPHRFLLSDSDPSVADAHDPRVTPDPFRNALFSLLNKLTDLFRI